MVLHVMNTDTFGSRVASMVSAVSGVILLFKNQPHITDVINVSGHRLSTAEIESALILHPGVAEAAVIGATDELTGQAVHAFVTLKPCVFPPRLGDSIRLLTVFPQRVQVQPRRRGGSGQGAHAPGSQSHRFLRVAQEDLRRQRPSQDALGQNYAPHHAQDRRG